MPGKIGISVLLFICISRCLYTTHFWQFKEAVDLFWSCILATARCSVYNTETCSFKETPNYKRSYFTRKLKGYLTLRSTILLETSVIAQAVKISSLRYTHSRNTAISPSLMQRNSFSTRLSYSLIFSTFSKMLLLHVFCSWSSSWFSVYFNVNSAQSYS
jgi:hypothetical protein